MKNVLPNREKDSAEWYAAVIQHADLADHGPAKGTMVVKPYGYALWEAIQSALDQKIKDRGVQNAYFPLFIPMDLIEKEKNHVEGFAPELAVVTHGGGEKLEQPLVIRPTSETIMYHMLSKWIHSYRDLPYSINQWCNVVRWEKRTHFFTRTSEFLWQEGHTAHATHEEAQAMQQWAIEAYKSIFQDELAIFGYVGEKSTSERFAGADNTLTYEALMPSGKTLQSSTSHDLGQNFAKSFDIMFSDQQGERQHVWQTSWGLSTRAIGGLIMAHGDNNGLRLPPRVAPVQVIVVPVNDSKEVLAASQTTVTKLEQAGYRARLDEDFHDSLGKRINQWELKGVPLRVEIGPRDLEANSAMCARRDDLSKESVKLDALVEYTSQTLESIQQSLLEATRIFTEERTTEVHTYEEFKQVAADTDNRGFIKVMWNDDPETEEKIKAETKYKSSCRLATDQSGTDFYSGEPASDVWLFAQSY